MVRRRVEGWPLKLSQLLRERATMEFAYGTNDCLLFPADVVKLLTNFDPAESLRGTYSTSAEAQAIVEDAGGLDAFITAQLGVESTGDIMKASRGDVVTVQLRFERMGGIVDDSGQRVALLTLDGLVRFPLEKALRLWRY